MRVLDTSESADFLQVLTCPPPFFFFDISLYRSRKDSCFLSITSALCRSNRTITRIAYAFQSWRRVGCDRLNQRGRRSYRLRLAWHLRLPFAKQQSRTSWYA